MTSLREWYVDESRQPVAWASALAAGRATVSVYRIVERPDGVILRYVWARPGTRLSADRVAHAQVTAAAAPVPGEPVPPPRPAPTGGSTIYENPLDPGIYIIGGSA